MRAKALHQRNIVNNTVEVFVAYRIATQCDNKGFTPVRMNIRRGFTKELNVVISCHGAIISKSGQ